MRNEFVERISICKVVQDGSGQKWLIRLADIEKGKVVKFVFDEDKPKYFDNRNRLHFKDGPDEVGKIGVWQWTAIPRDTDYEKDYIDSSFMAEIQPIEIVIIPGANSESTLVQKLQAGITLPESGIRTLFCYSSRKTEYSGVLIENHQLEIVNGWASLKQDVVSIPLYRVGLFDTIRTDDQRTFLRSLSLPDTDTMLLIKSPFEVIRGIILRRSSWAAVKSAGLTKSEYKRLKGYLTDIKDTTLYEEISDICGFTLEEAEAHVKSFIDNIQQYLDASDLDTQVIESIIESHEGLRKKAEEIAAYNWYKENAEAVARAKEEIDSYRDETEKEKSKLDSVHRELSAAQETLVRIQQDILEKEQLADEVEQKVANRISAAQKDAAEFIASMAFNMPLYTQTSVSSNEAIAGIAETVKDNTFNGIYYCGNLLDEETIDHYDTWNDVLITLEDELVSAGVDKKLSGGFAAFLYCAWKNHVPVLLAGPNTTDIADALSSAVVGKTADRIECSGNYTHISVPHEADGRVITVKNMFQGNWIDHITDLVDEKNYYIFVNPFTDDLAIEPKGLYNYMIPVFTDLIVSDKASHQYYGGKVKEEYVDYDAGAISDKYTKLLSQNAAGKLYITQIEHVLGDLSNMSGYRQDWDYYYVIIPYMLATGHKAELAEHIRKEGKISKECKEMTLNYLGVEE